MRARVTIPMIILMSVALYVACTKTEGNQPQYPQTEPLHAFTITDNMMDQAFDLMFTTNATRVRVIIYGQDSAVMYGVDSTGQNIKWPRAVVALENIDPCPPFCD